LQLLIGQFSEACRGANAPQGYQARNIEDTSSPHWGPEPQLHAIGQWTSDYGSDEPVTKCASLVPTALLTKPRVTCWRNFNHPSRQRVSSHVGKWWSGSSIYLEHEPGFLLNQQSPVGAQPVGPTEGSPRPWLTWRKSGGVCVGILRANCR